MKYKLKFPLHIHTATLFIILTIALGTGQIWFNFQKSTELIEESSIVLYEKVIQSAYLDLKSKYDIATTAVEILSMGGLPKATTLDERLEFLPVLSKVLETNQALSSFEVGYDNGDFFIIRDVFNAYMREQFKAPIGTLYMVDSIERLASNKTTGTRIFYDKHLNETHREVLQNIDYDPRTRPWYQLALRSDGYATTAPYLYFFVKKVGITITLESKHKGVVIAADITLDALSEILKDNVITPSAELVLIDANSQVIAYQNPKKIIVENQQKRAKIAHLSDLDSAILTEFSSELSLDSQVLNLDYNGELWGGVIKKLIVSKDFVMYFIFLAPDRELFAKALDIRWQSILIALLLIGIAVPITGYCAYKISEPLRRLTLQTKKIRQFDFTPEPFPHSAILEIHTLATDMQAMKYTISHFLSMIKSLAGEQDLDSLLATITKQTVEISRADAAVLYLINEGGDQVDPVSINLAKSSAIDFELSSYKLTDNNNIVIQSIIDQKPEVHQVQPSLESENNALSQFFEHLDTNNLQILTLPLSNRSGQATGILCVINNADNHSTENIDNKDKIGFIQSLSGFAAVSLESRHLLKGQKDLLASFIKLIAGAIDAKSHYTAGHCQRVPELTKLLAQAACQQNAGEFASFSLDKEQCEVLEIASWLHDCGIITTPEYVVDKATKLETIYDRIHEVRMRFEVLKRDAQLDYWKRLSQGGNKEQLNKTLETKLQQIESDFEFVGQCNLGSEFMSQAFIDRLQDISKQSWQRTISDRIGISWEEDLRKQREVEPVLPVTEYLLSDKSEHIIERDPKDVLQANNSWGFKMQTPEHQYNRGELYNLSIIKGTLNGEERYKINEHITQTIIMLRQLKFPKNLSNVEEIAGGHHEKMDGTGYPRRLSRDDMSITARMMAIADIFEALTASDRPYKKAKTLSEAIKIMGFMKRDQHIDGPLFELFLESGIYLDYAVKYLSAQQIDTVDISIYLSGDARKT